MTTSSSKTTLVDRVRDDLSGNWRRLVFVVGLLFSLLFIAIGFQQIYQRWQESQAEVQLERNARQVADAIANLVEDQRTAIRQAAETTAAAQIVADEPQPVELAELTDAERQVWLPVRVEMIDVQPYPLADFAAVAAALKAKEKGGIGGPVISGSDAETRLHWAAPVMRQTNATDHTLTGFVVASYVPQFAEAIALEVPRGSHIEVRIASSNKTGDVLYRVGSGAISNADVLEATEELSVHYGRSGSFWQITDSVPTALAMVLAGLILGVVVSVIYLKPKLTGSPDTEHQAPREKPLNELVDDELKEAMAFAETDETESSPVNEPSDIDASMFRAYDIRGIVGQSLTNRAARDIGKAVGSEAVDRGLTQIVVARDGRLSGPEMSEALIGGITSTGVDVVDIGAVPTGVLYFATHHLGSGSGVMVTGSHNPPDYNGFKIMLGGETLAAEAIQKLYQRIANGELESGAGGVQEMDLTEEYVDRIASDIQVEEPLKVVVDCGNGIPGMIAPQVLEEIGCEVIPLYCDVDGTFPNHHPDPSVAANLNDLILSVNNLDADIGVAFDGDGDRLGVVTRAGDIIHPDRLLMMFAEDVLLRSPGATIIYDVKCTGHLAQVILQHGGSPLMWKTGHSLIKGKMRETKAALAGEMSGHFFFKERWYGFDDGIYAAARLLEILASRPEGVDAALEALPNSISTPEIKIEMAEGEHYRLIEEFQSASDFPDARITDIDGIRADFPDGWGLVRCSNTTPCLVLRFEADSDEALAEIQGKFKEQLLAIKPDLNIPF